LHHRCRFLLSLPRLTYRHLTFNYTASIVMVGNFAALMAESKQRTEAVAHQAQEALANRQRKEEDRKRQQEEREKKEKELETKIRQRHFEEQQRVKEREQRQEKEREERQREQERRQRELEESLRGTGGRVRSLTSGSSGPRRRGHDLNDPDDGTSVALTREEKRERRLANDFRLPGASKRTSAPGAGAWGGRRLPGGAVDVLGSLRTPDSSRAGSTPRETRARLAASSNTLIQVRQKRERRPGETERDGRLDSESKILSGDQARNFGDWFSSKSKAEASKDDAPSKSRASLADQPPASSLASSSLAFAGRRKPAAHQSLSAFRTTSTPTSSSHSRSTLSASTNPPGKPGRPSPSLAKKRARSPSFDSEESETDLRPRRKTKTSKFQAEIWSIFGKNRDAYVSRNDYSDDDEDMEADAIDVEREEKRRYAFSYDHTEVGFSFYLQCTLGSDGGY
jgi:protein SPT2